VQNAGWAALAGLSSTDILLAIDGQSVGSITELKRILNKLREAKHAGGLSLSSAASARRFIELEPKW
jgi:S1-C subfamily serine protease